MEASGRRRSAVVALASCLAGCGGGESDKPSGPPLGKLLGALLIAADQTTAPWRCAASDVPMTADEDIKIGERSWRIRAHVLSRVGEDNEVVIGVVADAAGAAPRTVAALGRMRHAFDDAKPDLVLTLGGMGSTSDELQATLGTLSDRAPWPVVALPGDLESMSAQVSAVGALRKRGDVVLDGRSVRWIDLMTATIGTVPGAGAAERLVAGADGCAWQPDDVAKVTSELTTKPGVRIMATAEAPRQTLDGEPAGELALVPSKALPVEIVLHGPVQPEPTPTRNGSRDGHGTALSPGTADATSRLPHAHQPAAGVLVIRGGAWTWRPILDHKLDDK